MNALIGTLKLRMLLLLFALFFLPLLVSAQEVDPLIASAKGQGKIISPVDELKITSALVVLRKNGTVLITVNAELLLLAEGTWKTSDSSREEILLKITGGALPGELNGAGKLFLTSDRKAIKELMINAKSPDGQRISVTFTGADSEQLQEGLEVGEPLCGPLPSEDSNRITEPRNGLRMSDVVNSVKPITRSWRRSLNRPR